MNKNKTQNPPPLRFKLTLRKKSLVLTCTRDFSPASRHQLLSVFHQYAAAGASVDIRDFSR